MQNYPEETDPDLPKITRPTHSSRSTAATTPGGAHEAPTPHVTEDLPPFLTAESTDALPTRFDFDEVMAARGTTDLGGLGDLATVMGQPVPPSTEVRPLPLPLAHEPGPGSRAHRRGPAHPGERAQAAGRARDLPLQRRKSARSTAGRGR